MNISTPNINKIVKLICTKHGWPLWSNYSDKRVSGTRRLKYARNGWPVPDKMKNAILAELKGKLSQYSNVKSIYWDYSYAAGKGQYDVVIMEVVDTDKNLDPNATDFIASEQKKMVDAVFSKGLSTYVTEDTAGGNLYVLQETSDVKAAIKQYAGAPTSQSLRSTWIRWRKTLAKAKPVSPKRIEDLKQALGPARIKDMLEAGKCLIPKEVYDKLQ